MDVSFGWIGQRKMKISGHTHTDTAKYIKYYAKQCGAVKYQGEELRNIKNLIKKEQEYYYILSIGKGHSTWPLATFVMDRNTSVKPVILILTRDKEDNMCEMWIVKNTDKLTVSPKEKYKYDELSVKSLNEMNSEHYDNVYINEIDEKDGNNQSVYQILKRYMEKK